MSNSWNRDRHNNKDVIGVYTATTTYWKCHVQQMEQFVRLDYADAGHDDSCPTGSSPDRQPAYSVNLNVTIHMVQTNNFWQNPNLELHIIIIWLEARLQPNIGFTF